MNRLFLCLLLSLSHLLADVDFRRGAFALVDYTNGIEVVERAGDLAIERDELPQYVSGLLRVNSSSEGSAYLHASIGVGLFFVSPGDMSVERFDIGYAKNAEENDTIPIQSRLNLNLRGGELFIDSRRDQQNGVLIIETPVARVYVGNGLVFVGVEFDQRKSVYNFEIVCLEGDAVRVVDRRRQSYELFLGQRLVGAGSFGDPAIEVGEMTPANMELFQEFLDLQASLDFDALDLVALEQATVDIPDFERRVFEPAANHQPKSSIRLHDEKRPVVIDYAPKPRRMTPFRGVTAVDTDSSLND